MLRMAMSVVSTLPKPGALSSLSSLQGRKFEFEDKVYACGGNKGVCWRPGFVVRAASKQKTKKGKEKRRSGSGAKGQGWSFDQLMLVWDDAFDKTCEDSSRVATLRAIGKKGLERYGSGCVLVQETVRTLPRGSASGFSNHSRPSSKDEDEPPQYTTLHWTAEYVPRTFVRDPSLAPAIAPVMDETDGTPLIDVTSQVNSDVPLVSRGNLISILRGMDHTRILGLTADETTTFLSNSGQAEPQAVDAGGEKPYNPKNEELVLMLAVIVDGQPAVGADIIRAVSKNLEDVEDSWKFEVRDFHTLPV